MDYVTFLIRLGVCFILGSLIGLERQWRRRAIGLRTTALVCLGSFLFVFTSCLAGDVNTTRVAAQVVSGIGFLGAGVILRDGTHVRGLNTAATLWCSAAVGTLCAFGFLFEAIVGTVCILLSNIVLRFLSNRISRSQKEENDSHYLIKIRCKTGKEIIIRSLLMQKINAHDMTLRHMDSKEVDKDYTNIEVDIEVSSTASDLVESLVNRIGVEPGVVSIGFEKHANLEQIGEEEDN